MRFILLIVLSIFSYVTMAANDPKTGQMDRKECECETCLAKGNCVFRDDQGRMITEKVVSPGKKSKTNAPSGATGI